jgi:glycosyltransferase involved in cell wall biosynthesis
VTTSVHGSAGDLGSDVVETLAPRGRRVPHRVLGVDRAYRYHDWRTSRMLASAAEPIDVVHGWPLGSEKTFQRAAGLGIPSLRESPNLYTARAYELVADEVARLGLVVPPGASHHFDPTRLAREEREYDACTAVLAPSAAVAESYGTRPGPPLRVLRHRYGFDPDRFPAPGAVSARSSFTMLFVGHCEPRKGVHHALEAWSRAGLWREGGRFVIVGRWEPGYRELLEGRLRTPGVEVREFSDDVGALMREADVLTLPSVEEGSALVTYEAQASGCALLVSDAAGALMVEGAHGLVHRTGDVEELTNQLTRLAAEPAELLAMRTAAVAHRHELSWDAAAERLEALYGEVAV